MVIYVIQSWPLWLKINEGMDLKAVRHIHLLEPLFTDAMVQQTIGRSTRFVVRSCISTLEVIGSIFRFITHY